ncbi:hypothetical protein SBI_05147 [Streptomyces bingchenggensis BCW-1]|uniref:Uncharacterized protein n=1 Tax=Streptomyces bingchenggensis (strain BCW-1) TaxID=749414 RepID=D7C541_STRBB|nr:MULTISPECIES: hypothetical protein [Streptomyces]ADI08267.1 hypothetical protein SBI_05147 [Streptomyces bingchenggensis BCW-1]
MTTPPTSGRNDAWEMDQLHRDEITVAMNWVIRTCQEIVRNRSHKTYWAPATTSEGTPSPEQLMQTAREDVIDKLQRIIDGAQFVMHHIERERTKRKQ